MTNAASPEGSQNQLNRRQYVTEGDFSTYYVGDSRSAILPIAYNGRQMLSRYVSRVKANTHAFKEIDTTMLAAQSFWFQERLVTTLGWRLDQVTFRNEGEARVASPTDPRIASVKHEEGLLSVTARENSGPAQGSITLNFTDAGNVLELRQWDVVDAQGARTTVVVSEMRQVADLPARLFIIEDLSPFKKSDR
mgnify:CR=1 FL=1